MAKQTQEPEIEQIVGFEWDPRQQVYSCQDLECGKTYVYASRAKKHYETKHALPTDASIEGELTSYVIGGDVLRGFIKDLQSGVIDVPRLISNLNVAALTVDMLLDEIKQADIRLLSKKAKAWDGLVSMLPSIPGVYEMLLEARDAGK